MASIMLDQLLLACQVTPPPPSSLALLRGPNKSGMVMASTMMDQMLLACQGFTHVNKVVAAVAVCLEQALGMLASSGADGKWSGQS